MEKKNLKRNFPKSKKKVGRKKSKNAKIIQNLEEAEEKRLRTSKGNESMGMNKDSRTLEVKEEDSWSFISKNSENITAEQRSLGNLRLERETIYKSCKYSFAYDIHIGTAIQISYESFFLENYYL